MSNPNGPEAVAQCVKPIEQLKSDLRRHMNFPTCEEAQGSAYVRAATFATYAPCPSGTAALGRGELARLSSATLDVLPSVGIGEGDVAPITSSDPIEPPAKVCVGAQIGSYNSSEPGQTTNPIGVYETVISLPAQLSSGSYEVVVGNSVYQRVQLGQ